MKVLVNEMPKTAHDCLFSKHSCEYGWLCSLHRKETMDRTNINYYDIPKCNIEKCPYLQILEVKHDLQLGR